MHNLHMSEFRLTKYGPQIQRVCLHNNWGVSIKVLTLVNNSPWCVVLKYLLYPPIELHGHRGSVWRVIKCVPSVQSIHDYYPFTMEDGGRLAPMAAELVDRLAILVAVRRFLGMGVADSRSLRSDNYVRM
jgi:hypothetical protein